MRVGTRGHWSRRLALLCLGLLLIPALPVSAREPPVDIIGDFAEIRLVPAAGVTVSIRGRTYEGDLVIRAAPDGLAIVEETDLDGYLAGIREVPFSWPAEALAAQAVAARTFLASSLAAGRTGSGRRYGFDICASIECQVYAGAGIEEIAFGDRWAAAVDRTAGELLLFEGRPASTFYHSTSGGRTEAIQDIWRGSSRVPYLQGAESPGETSPFVDWRVAVPVEVFAAVLLEGGFAIGHDLRSVDVLPSEQGEGVWMAQIRATNRGFNLDVARLRAIMNLYGPELFPDELPAVRPDGRRYPQSILSYRYALELERPRDALIDSPNFVRLPVSDLPPEGSVVFTGRGWGHHVGMSQYGAKALADQGLSYGDILAHFYGGLRPSRETGLLADTLTVGLSWGDEEIVVTSLGPVLIEADGAIITGTAGGEWSFRSRINSRIGIAPPLSHLSRVISLVRGVPHYL